MDTQYCVKPLNLYIKIEIPGVLPRKLHHGKEKWQVYIIC
jgi:hypothetical protein